MVGELAAAGCALAWGTSDYCGGRASRWGNSAVVVLAAQASSIPLLGIALLLTADSWPSSGAIVWGLLAGLCGGTGLLLLYRTLAMGAMSVVAPITAVTSALLPLLVGLFLDRPPGAVALVGAVLAVVAIGLVSLTPGAGGLTRSLIGVALAAGAFLGLFYVLLTPVSSDAGLWPLVGVRIGVLVTTVLLVLRTAESVRLPATSVRWALVAGALDVVANAAYLFAAYHGQLSVVAPIASLYPVTTVLLALFVDRERLRPVQVGALCLAALALVLTH